MRNSAPDGFTGPNDVWHQHTHLCIVNGWVDREGVGTPHDCAGEFATLHPALCPGPADAAPDISRCEALSIPAG